MKLRWCIRGFAVALLTLCLSVWGWSYFHHFSIEYRPSLGESYRVEIYKGKVVFGFTEVNDGPSSGWRFEHRCIERGRIIGMELLVTQLLYTDREFLAVDRRFLGFAYFKRTNPIQIWGVGIPFWFISLLLAGLVWFVWRRTRGEMAGRGFPVEVTQNK